MKNQTITAAIIGCGVIAPTHAESLQKIADVQIKWCCDLDAAKSNALAKKFSIPHQTADYHEILHDPEVDLVTVATDHASHSAITVAAIAAGKHVICEKALSSSIDKIQAMTGEHAFHPDLVFSGVFQHRFEPTNRLLKKLIAEGAFGQIQTVAMNVSCFRGADYYNADAWRGTQAFEGGGVLINQAIHHLDLMRFFFGDVATVSATTANRTHQGVIEVEDAVAMTLEFRSGTLATVTATSSSEAMPWRNIFAITGTEGYLEYIDMQPAFMKFMDDATTEKIRKEFEACKFDPALAAGKSYYGTGHPAQFADVVDAIREKRAPFVRAEDAAETALLVQAVYDANRYSCRIRL